VVISEMAGRPGPERPQPSLCCVWVTRDSVDEAAGQTTLGLNLLEPGERKEQEEPTACGTVGGGRRPIALSRS
jgi:hypothetical protein